MTIQYRQGDVLLVSTSEIPPTATPKHNLEQARLVLAYGEGSGHAHAIALPFARAYLLGEDTFINVEEGAELTHEEHLPIRLEPGCYQVVLQRQYQDPWTPHDEEWMNYMD